MEVGFIFLENIKNAMIQKNYNEKYTIITFLFK